MTFVIVSGGIDPYGCSIFGLYGMVAGYLVLNGFDLGSGWSIQSNTSKICLIVAAVGLFIGTLYVARLSGASSPRQAAAARSVALLSALF